VQTCGPHPSRTARGRPKPVNDPVLARAGYKIFENGPIKPVPLSPVTCTHPPKHATGTRLGKPVKLGPHTRAHLDLTRATRTPYLCSFEPHTPAPTYTLFPFSIFSYIYVNNFFHYFYIQLNCLYQSIKRLTCIVLL
jgi:hypothetical protein